MLVSPYALAISCFLLSFSLYAHSSIAPPSQGQAPLYTRPKASLSTDIQEPYKLNESYSSLKTSSLLNPTMSPLGSATPNDLSMPSLNLHLLSSFAWFKHIRTLQRASTSTITSNAIDNNTQQVAANADSVKNQPYTTRAHTLPKENTTYGTAMPPVTYAQLEPIAPLLQSQDSYCEHQDSTYPLSGNDLAIASNPLPAPLAPSAAFAPTSHRVAGITYEAQLIAQAYEKECYQFQDFKQRQAHLATLKPSARTDILWQPKSMSDIRRNRVLSNAHNIEERIKLRTETHNFISKLEQTDLTDLQVEPGSLP